MGMIGENSFKGQSWERWKTGTIDIGRAEFDHFTPTTKTAEDIVIDMFRSEVAAIQSTAQERGSSVRVIDEPLLDK
jgi:hypothetical protein